MTSLIDQIVAIASALDEAAVPWAFGGALALAYATEWPRGTRGIDVNVFVPADHAVAVFGALPSGPGHGLADIERAVADDQVRLMWGDTPVDIFFAADPFHAEVASRTRSVPFVGGTIHVLAPEDLAVFKVLFDRPKDWVDIAAMVDAGALDVDELAGRVAGLIGDDARVGRVCGMCAGG